MLKAFKVENFSNFIKLKYELKRALNQGHNPSLAPEKQEILEIPIIPENSDPVIQVDYKSIVAASEKVSFAKETMAMYPMELHPVYRQRISDFYEACELKFILNAQPEKAEKESLALIIKIEKLWDKIDRAWMVLEHWKDNARIMPFTTSVDYSTYTGIQLANEKDLLESRISKRDKTLKKLEEALDADPNNRTAANQYLIKKEALEQLKIDLETIKKLLKNE
jgi:hypothetical protein